MIELVGAGFVYAPRTPWEHRALHPVDLRIEPGEAILVVGPNGSGKSTLAWMLAGLLVPSEGMAMIDGQPLHLAAGATAMAFQHARLQLFRPTVAADVAFGTRLQATAINDALELVGLDPRTFRARRIDDLSGGEQRRVALAGALVRRPRVLVLDEPLAGLDRSARAGLVDGLAAFRRGTGAATVVVTHDIEDARRLATRALALDGGRVIVDGPVSAVVSAWTARR